MAVVILSFSFARLNGFPGAAFLLFDSLEEKPDELEVRVTGFEAALEPVRARDADGTGAGAGAGEGEAKGSPSSVS